MLAPKIIFFYLFASVLILSALGVVVARNPVRAVLCLVLSFFNAAAIWLLLGAEFLAIVLVLVYVGAVMVLFLFVVMMLDVVPDNLHQAFWRNARFGLLVGAVVLLEILLLIWKIPFAPDLVEEKAVSGSSNIAMLAELLYTDYALPFEVAGLVLLLAIVAALMLTLHREKRRLVQDPAQQVRVNKNERLRLVTIPPFPTEAPHNEVRDMSGKENPR